ncbi:phage tail tape measure protein [Bacillus cereus group sp. N12]|uniref:phage tail tape measure protein n=1 Tax=Bacillus cereus group sp. N12 TaxID=2794586 RepID=UPI0018F4BE36|nr:phage tail tape measure protein [Bacillus cereus group sp. N12]MBJ8075255.1 phage tail tape measure protein [Bacillus cereus group sp. N12]
MIDNLLDGLKEGRIKAAEFGQGVDKAMKETLEGTNISAEQLQKWGQSVANGGKEGSAAMSEIAAALANVEDNTKRNELGVKLFGTMWEDQGDNITYAILGAQSKVVDFDKNQQKLNESIKKMDASPAVKFQQAMQDLQVALEPLLGVVADVISKFAEWISNNPELAATLAAVATAIGIISGAIMALAPIVVTVMSIFGVGAAVAAGIVAIVPIIIAAIVALGFAINKNWEDIKNWTIDTYNFIKDYLVGLWSGIVETASSWLSSLVESVSGWWSSLVESTITWLSSMVETASSWWSSLVETTSQFFMQLFQKWQETWQSILTFLDPIISLISTLLKAGWLLIQAGAQIAWAAISQYIIQPIQEAYNWVSVKISELVAWLGTQWELAKSYTLAGWNLIKQYVIQPVQELWNTTKQKLSDLANWILSNWESIKSYTLSAWNLVKQYVINPITETYNQAKQKFTDLYNSAKEKFDSVKNAAQEKFDAAKRNIIDPIKEAVGKVEEFIGKIKGFFEGLKLKIPKPEMPPMPHFSLETSTKNVLGKDVTYPSGINIDWRAKGGIFTKPTIFGMMGGNLQGAGEAGPEAVLPLNKKTLGSIGAGIAAAMPREQFAMPGEINQLMGDMSRMMASSVSQLSGLKTVMSGVYGNMSNSKQAMTSSVSNQVFNNSFGSSGDGVIPMLGGDLVVEVPVVIEGRDVARGTYRYTTEYQEREKQRDSAF